MMTKIARLFTIRTKFDAFLIIYALALGAVERGRSYMDEYPGVGGLLLFAACASVVFLAGGIILDYVDKKRAEEASGL